MSQASLLVQNDLNNPTRGIKTEEATDVKDITDHPQRAVVVDLSAIFYS